MKQTAIFPGRYVQGEGVLEGLGEEIQRLGTKALLIVGNTAENKIRFKTAMTTTKRNQGSRRFFNSGLKMM